MFPKTRLGFAHLLHFCLLIAGASANTLEYQGESWPVLKRNLSHPQSCGPIKKELKLSSTAVIIAKEDPSFAEAVKRWQEWKNPTISCVVEVANEADVAATITYANKRGIPFLAVNEGHGATSSLGSLKNGMLISLKQLNKVQVNGQTATIGGGTLNKDATAALKAHNKIAVVGSCECVSVMGPMLGGGHSLLQGTHGLATDNLVKARLVLANGTAVSASKTENPDLFWAVRGAGHNFGIVTEIEYKVIDEGPEGNWFYENYFFGASAAEAIVERMFSIQKDQPGELFTYAIYLRVPDLDAQSAVIALTVIYHGASADAQQHTAPFRAMGPLSVENGTGTYSDMPAVTFTSLNDVVCKKIGVNRLRTPVYMNSFKNNKNYAREAYNIFNETTSKYPEFAPSLFLIEGYSTKAVRAVPLADTAVAVRDHGIFISPVIEYPVKPGFDKIAIKFGKQLRDLSVKADGNQIRAYVNYALGDESLESRYGYEQGRVKKLQKLKRQYDPDSKFSWYNPLVAPRP